MTVNAALPIVERLNAPSPRGEALIEALRDFIPSVIRKNATPGLNIALADDGRLIWEAGFGLSDVATGRPMTPDTAYRSGSLGKTYTATAAMILVDRGIVRLDDPISRHLPQAIDNPLGDRPITVLDLLVHKSGLGPDAAGAAWLEGSSLAETISTELSSDFSPIAGGRLFRRWCARVGEKWQYSNLGVAILGLIVESTNPDGLSFAGFVQRHVMDRLGMEHSQYPEAQVRAFTRPDLWQSVSTGYVRMGGADVPTLPVVFRETPAGAAFQRPADHLRLLLAMINGGQFEGVRLLSAPAVQQMLAPSTDITLSAVERAAVGFWGEQGLIWRLNDHAQEWRSFDHAGGHMFGWMTQGRAWPAQGTAVVVAVNQWTLPDQSSETREIPDFIGSWIRHRAPDPGEEGRSLSPREVSYVRGMLFGAAYRIFNGMDGLPPAGLVADAAATVRDREGDWDGDAFIRGVDALFSLPPTIEAVVGFWNSPDCEVSAPVAKSAFAKFGAKKGGLMDFLLPP